MYHAISNQNKTGVDKQILTLILTWKVLLELKQRHFHNDKQIHQEDITICMFLIIWTQTIESRT